jgi:hypothetical protein
VEKSSSFFKFFLAILLIFLSWFLFPFFTFGNGEENLYLIPAYFFALQLIVSIILKIKKLVLISFLHPAFVLPVLFSIMPIFNYLLKKPTLFQCSYQFKEREFDQQKKLFISYADDDCDYTYKYTHEINNSITYWLLKSFGNPVK